MKKAICPLCKKTHVDLVYPATIAVDYLDKPYKISSSDYGQHLDIFKCRSCNTIFENIAGLEKRIDRHYRSLDDSAYEDERDNRALAFKRIVEQLKKLKTLGRLLDIGCATGAFLVEARNAGYKVYGIEPSGWAAKIAQKKYHLDVTEGTIETVQYPQNHFEVIALLDVIEHLNDPNAALLKISKLLKRDGILIIVTPNSSSFAAKVLGEKWWHIRPSHFFYFNPSTFYPVLKRAGFEVIKRRNYKWYLSAAYLLERGLTLFSLEWKKMPHWLANMIIGINLFDSMEIYAVKK